MSATARETLKEAVTREMVESAEYDRTACPHELRIRLCADCAVSVALRLLSEWGHVARCNCCDAAGDTVIRYEFDDAALPVECTEDNHVHPYRDPECAQPGGEEGKRG